MNKAIFWDSDGTLIYGNESFAYSLVKACEEVGCHINIDDSRKLMRSIGKYISGYTTSASAGYEKPDINIYNQAMRAAGYPDVCYMIGDNPKTDYAGGLAAGMKPVLVHNEDAGCECSCAKLIDLKNIIIE